MLPTFIKFAILHGPVFYNLIGNIKCTKHKLERQLYKKKDRHIFGGVTNYNPRLTIVKYSKLT